MELVEELKEGESRYNKLNVVVLKVESEKQQLSTIGLEKDLVFRLIKMILQTTIQIVKQQTIYLYLPMLRMRMKVIVYQK
eukprot:2563655-Ditylum_brightwellii.AAC.1